jgi:hypothetical protein
MAAALVSESFPFILDQMPHHHSYIAIVQAVHTPRNNFKLYNAATPKSTSLLYTPAFPLLAIIVHLSTKLLNSSSHLSTPSTFISLSIPSPLLCSVSVIDKGRMGRYSQPSADTPKIKYRSSCFTEPIGRLLPDPKLSYLVVSFTITVCILFPISLT